MKSIVQVNGKRMLTPDLSSIEAVRSHLAKILKAAIIMHTESHVCLRSAYTTRNHMPDNSDLEGSTHRAPKPTFLTQTPFNSFSLPKEILNGLDSAGFTYCTPIQAQTLSSSLSGRDIAGQAQTGTGKTAAFLITIFARLVHSSPAKAKDCSVRYKATVNMLIIKYCLFTVIIFS